MDPVVPDYILDSVRSLPPLPAAVGRLIALAHEIDTDFRQIAAVIEADQTLTARTLRAANSAMYGVSRRVQTVRQATVLLGRETIMNLAVGASVLGLKGSMAKPWPVNPEAFWRHTMAVAMMARTLALHLRLPDPEEAFAAGLLHDIGKLVMLEHFGDLYGQVLMAAQYGSGPLHQLEREVLETDHAVVGHALCLHWNIPPSLTRAVAEHHDESSPAPNSVADIVRDANDMVKLARIGNSGNEFVALRSSTFLPHNQIRPDVMRHMLMDLPEQVRKAEEVFSNVSEKQDEQKPGIISAVCPLVHLQVTIPEEREALVIMLWSLGYEPVLLNEEPSATDAERASAPLAGFISDLPLTPAQNLVYGRREVPVLDYALWRSLKGQPSGGHLNFSSLEGWLHENLLHPHEQEV